MTLPDCYDCAETAVYYITHNNKKALMCPECNAALDAEGNTLGYLTKRQMIGTTKSAPTIEPTETVNVAQWPVKIMKGEYKGTTGTILRKVGKYIGVQFKATLNGQVETLSGIFLPNELRFL